MMSQGDVDLGFFQETKVRGGGGFREIVERLPICGNGDNEPAPRRRCGILLQGGSLLLRGALTPRTELCQISDGDRTEVVAYRGVLYFSQRRLDHRELSCGHQQTALRVQTAGGWRLQCRPGRAREDCARGGYQCGTSGRRLGRHERPFPPEMQILDEGWAHMQHTARDQVVHFWTE